MLFQHTINKGSFVHLEFQTMICISRAEKGIFSKRSFYTKLFNDPKYSFSVCHKYFFSVKKKLLYLFHHSLTSYVTLNFMLLHTSCNSIYNPLMFLIGDCCGCARVVSDPDLIQSKCLRWEWPHAWESLMRI